MVDPTPDEPITLVFDRLARRVRRTYVGGNTDLRSAAGIVWNGTEDHDRTAVFDELSILLGLVESVYGDELDTGWLDRLMVGLLTAIEAGGSDLEQIAVAGAYAGLPDGGERLYDALNAYHNAAADAELLSHMGDDLGRRLLAGITGAVDEWGEMPGVTDAERAAFGGADRAAAYGAARAAHYGFFQIRPRRSEPDDQSGDEPEGDGSPA